MMWMKEEFPEGGNSRDSKVELVRFKLPLVVKSSVFNTREQSCGNR
jgi:hypothetical protein